MSLTVKQRLRLLQTLPGILIVRIDRERLLEFVYRVRQFAVCRERQAQSIVRVGASRMPLSAPAGTSRWPRPDAAIA